MRDTLWPLRCWRYSLSFYFVQLYPIVATIGHTIRIKNGIHSHGEGKHKKSQAADESYRPHLPVLLEGVRRGGKWVIETNDVTIKFQDAALGYKLQNF